MSEKLAYRKIENAGITLVQGIQAAAVHCGLKKRKLDLALVYSSRDCAAAGFTRNRVQAAPVRLCRKAIAGPIRALVVNSGNANACTGEAGMQTPAAWPRWLPPPGAFSAQVLVCSTGVIGQQLPMELVEGALPGRRRRFGERKAGRGGPRHPHHRHRGQEVAYRGTYGGATFHLAGMARDRG